LVLELSARAESIFVNSRTQAAELFIAEWRPLARGDGPLLGGKATDMPVRRHHPESIHFVTNRCEQEMFRLIPHENIKALIVEWLARALTYLDGGIEIYAYCFLSNHIHLFLRDKSGKLAKFMGYFQGNLARAFSLDRETKKILRHKIIDHTNEYRSAYGAYANWATSGRRPIVEWPVGSYPPSCHEPRQAA
jgi:REP element-mobilizing transposase RayT